MTTPRTSGFGPGLRLRHSRDFSRLRQGGRKIHTRHFVIYLLTRPDGSCRLGLTVSRKVGGAVQRNALKRFLREWFRLTIGELPPHTDISVVARSNAGNLGFSDIREELKCLAHPGSCHGGQP
ncbi:ribonuclease P protein component [Desulfuromonas carbonis]